MANQDDRVFVRAHVRRRPTPRGATAAKGSGWLAAGAVAAFLLWAHFVGFSDTPPAAPPPAPAPASPAPAVPAPTAIGPSAIGAP